MGVKAYFQGLCMYSEQGASCFGSKAEITSAPALWLLKHGRYRDDYLPVSEGCEKEMIQRAVVPRDIKAKHSEEIASVHQEEISTDCYAARGPSGSPAT